MPLKGEAEVPIGVHEDVRVMLFARVKTRPASRQAVTVAKSRRSLSVKMLYSPSVAHVSVADTGVAEKVGNTRAPVASAARIFDFTASLNDFP